MVTSQVTQAGGPVWRTVTPFRNSTAFAFAAATSRFRSSSVAPLDRAEHRGGDHRGTRRFQRQRCRAQGRARRHDVVDEHHLAACQEFAA
ncbi:hypothetical protein [Leucobacter ruminantium]|uniref:hypothetical protein n=1 Tax=Leucobacter ruminantium TaxID=1289170 RepID=UPI001FB64DCF|nr:hypothetical protein [Leucobacter ruminantium]